MKRYTLIMLAVAVSAAVACEETTGGSGEPAAPYTLSVDKSVIESDGTDAATFIITDANGMVLTTDEWMSKIYFINESTGSRLARKTKTFSTIEDGKSVFSATFRGEYCENTVEVTSQNRSSYEMFRKNVAVYRMTATWCQYCPTMTEAMDALNDWTKGRVVEMDFHGAGSDFAYSYGNQNVAARLISQFGASGYPSCVYGLDLMSASRDNSEIEAIVFDQLVNHPATCGIKASVEYAHGAVQMKATVKSSAGGTYDVGFAILKDNCLPGSGAYEDIYHNVVVACTGNYSGMSSESFTLEAGAESEEVSQAVTITDLTEDDLDDLSVVAFVLGYDAEGEVIIDNVVEVPVGESVDYIYN